MFYLTELKLLRLCLDNWSRNPPHLAEHRMFDRRVQLADLGRGGQIEDLIEDGRV